VRTLIFSSMRRKKDVKADSFLKFSSEMGRRQTEHGMMGRKKEILRMHGLTTSNR